MNAVGSTRSQGGATLLEHVVALAVLAMVVVSVFTLLSVGYLARRLAQDQSVATHLAQRKLEEFRSGGVEAATTMVRQAVDPAAFRGSPVLLEDFLLRPKNRDYVVRELIAG